MTYECSKNNEIHFRIESTSLLFQDLRAEIDAHTDVLRSLRETGASMLASLETTDDKQKTEQLLTGMNERWDELLVRSRSVRKRLEKAQEQWEQLTDQMQELLYWMDLKNKALLSEQPVGGDLKTVQQQMDFVTVSEFSIAWWHNELFLPF